ncbi:hypothetical protein OEZ85_010612 [Tetradesmus obliquus]|uniref:Uncharacterized protein n=1 Tax=Tetradesmus obliquus TaxID=3088 RepID=A0ABY8TMU9_TETOB|nr:hypothetical protein OEZ85_010612 [Tetradesmus obliquus]
MSVLKRSHVRQLNPDIVQQRIIKLQEAFGADAVNSILSSAPELLDRKSERMVEYFRGLSQLLGAGDAFALEVVVRCPDLLGHRPEMVQMRLQNMAKVLQVDHAALLRLIKKSPTVLKLNAAKVQQHVEFLAELGGLSPQQVYKAYVNWPVLMTISVPLLKARFAALARLLAASPEHMKKICRVFPNLLGRDPSQLDANLSLLAQQLGLPKERIVAFARNEPGLLSWNVSTLLSRIMATRSVLRLPPELALSLLAFNRPLLNRPELLPQKLQALQRVLGVTEEELYPLVHGYMTLLRFDTDSVEAKMACAGSLARLSERWSNDWSSLSVLSKVRTIQAGWSCHWRLVYLLQSGQAHSVSLLTALRISHQKFLTAFPDYLLWLHRYNQAVQPPGITILSQLPAQSANAAVPHLTGPDCFPSILFDFLVQTQQQVPWAFSLRELLLSYNNTVLLLREKFCAAYPGFEQWEQSMKSL